MRYNDVAKLISYEIREGIFSDEGEKIKSVKEVYINKHKNSLSNKINSSTEDFKLNGTCEMREVDFSGEKEIEIDGKIHHIMDTSSKGENIIIYYGENKKNV